MDYKTYNLYLEKYVLCRVCLVSWCSTLRTSADEGIDASVVDLKSPFRKRKKKLETFFIVLHYHWLHRHLLLDSRTASSCSCSQISIYKTRTNSNATFPKMFLCSSWSSLTCNLSLCVLPLQSMLLTSQGPLQQFSHIY